MTSIFLSPEELGSSQIIISGENARYLSSVLRMQAGELLTILDGHGNRYICSISNIHKKEILAEKIKKESYSAESRISITLAQGMPKGEKMDLIVQKSTELGVHKIIPLITERSQIRHTEKSERWRKIALSASQQSGRERIPDVAEPLAYDIFLNGINSAGSACLFFSEEENSRNLKAILKQIKDYSEIVILIGPEGGFSKTELAEAVEKGFISVSLGPRILRTETAGLAALSILQFELGDMG